MEIFPVGVCTFYERLTVRIAADGVEKKVKAIEGVPDMIRQIYMDYHLPIMPDELTMKQVHFFYDARIPALITMQKYRKEMRKKNGK